eukprot:TRINITY_DN51465_c0_g1_i1.p1 TRINITY_DN51465_c0_g1~~TRINITY_DN51465_c0_g1_i1.p1  ORF type:complete len:184 (-),score=20.31 TRINITY_DN51465_c0_g1_i1:18-569(-)
MDWIGQRQDLPSWAIIAACTGLPAGLSVHAGALVWIAHVTAKSYGGMAPSAEEEMAQQALLGSRPVRVKRLWPPEAPPQADVEASPVDGSQYGGLSSSAAPRSGSSDTAAAEEDFPRALEHLECSICCGPLKGDGAISRAACSHSFHEQCLFKWLRHRVNCPVCRTDLREAGEPRGMRRPPVH